MPTSSDRGIDGSPTDGDVSVTTRRRSRSPRSNGYLSPRHFRRRRTRNRDQRVFRAGLASELHWATVEKVASLGESPTGLPPPAFARPREVIPARGSQQAPAEHREGL